MNMNKTDSQGFIELNRRGLFHSVFTGLAGIGLGSLLQNDSMAKDTPWEPGRGMTHFSPKAKRVLQIFCPGAASHLDLWDYKPELFKHQASHFRAGKISPPSKARMAT
jgi:hypothetical protein